MNYIKNLAFRFTATIIISAITSAWVVYYVVDQSLTKSETALETTNQRIVDADQQVSNNGALLQQNVDAISKLEMSLTKKLQYVSLAVKDAQSGAINQDLTLRAMDANSALQLNMDFVNIVLKAGARFKMRNPLTFKPCKSTSKICKHRSIPSKTLTTKYRN